ncbi:dynein heavy chain 14, axonemal isoform X2 [Rhinatrema bivittatum]|uniref:dynein heavy chain 14, axonemal isoform X2 n=1 Tax=Rhinatrema bivittatum TaxID=194408 RepID=UPI0011290553|nr:dynein heavy chain 14, axonemal isoform X2 [Rhinatrema bivittatum]
MGEQRPLPHADVRSRLILRPGNSDVLQMALGKTATRETEAVSIIEDSSSPLRFPLPPVAGVGQRSSGVIRTSLRRGDPERRRTVKAKEGAIQIPPLGKHKKKTITVVSEIDRKRSRNVEMEECSAKRDEKVKITNAATFGVGNGSRHKLSMPSVERVDEASAVAAAAKDAERKKSRSNLQGNEGHANEPTTVCNMITSKEKKKQHQNIQSSCTSCLKTAKTNDPVYDKTEPEDDDIISHILRLRSKLGWQTVLPQHGSEGKNAMLVTYKNPLKKLVPPKEDSGEYVYCLPRNRNGPEAHTNPYDLQVVSADAARHANEYWIVSASFVSKVALVSGVETLDIVSVMEWLQERTNYFMIHNLNVFSQFRLWKAFTVWKINVRRSKTDNSKTIMSQQLFSADELFQGCLLHMRALCEDAITTRGGPKDSSIVLVKLGEQYCTYSLKEFCELQSRQSDEALGRLQSLRGRFVEAIAQTFLKVTAMKGAPSRFQLGAVEGKERPRYAEVAQWCGLREQLVRFLKLVDSIFQEFLFQLVCPAIQLLLQFFEASSSVTTSEERRNEELLSDFDKGALNESDTAEDPVKAENNQNPSQVNTPKLKVNAKANIDKALMDIRRQREVKEKQAPVFEVNVALRFSEKCDATRDSCRAAAPEASVVPGSGCYSPVTSAKRQTQGMEKGDVLTKWTGSPGSRAHEMMSENGKKKVTSESSSRDNNDLSDTAVSDGSGDEEEQTSDGPLGLSSSVRLSPSRTEFNLQMQGIVDGLEHTVAQLVAFSQERRLSRFLSLPTNSVTSDEDVEIVKNCSRTPWPNIDLLLGMDADYQSNIKKLYLIINASVTQVESYCKDFRQYCRMVDEAQSVYIKISGTESQLSPNDFRSILAKYTQYVQDVKWMNVEKRVRIMKVLSMEYQMDCLPHIEAVVQFIHSSLPTLAHAKNMQLLEIIHQALRKLDKELTTVEEFVDHLTFLGQMSSEMPSLEREYNIIIQLYCVARDYNICIPLEELALYHTLAPLFQHLKSTILVCEARKDKDIIQFSGDLDRYISDLHFELMEFKNKVRNPDLLRADTLPGLAKEMIQYLLDELSVISRKARSYSSYRDRFGSSVSEMRSFSLEVSLAERNWSALAGACALNVEVGEIEGDLGLRKLLWEAKEEWGKLSVEWKRAPFEHLDVDAMQRDVSRFTHTVHLLEKGLPENDIVASLKQSIIDFKHGLPIIVALRNPCLQPRHWDVIQYTIGRTIIKDKNFTLGNLLELKIFQHEAKISDVSIRATNEATLEAMLKKIIDIWNRTDFQLVVHQSEASNVMIIASSEEIVAQLEECQIMVSIIEGSRYVGPIKDTVDEWDRKLNLFSRTLEEWMTCQRNWLYLEQIFCVPDIQRQLPAEAKLFSQVDNAWQEIMIRTAERPNALRAATTAGLLEMLQTSNAHLEKIQKCLEDYLEIKRMVFPRFYFLSNDELLNILAESKNPDVVQPHLVKCFENIRWLDIQQRGKSPPVVVMVRSAEGENVLLPNNVRIRGPVEQWLGNLETAMFDTVKKLVTAGVKEWSKSEFRKWVTMHPGQVVLVVSQIMFSKDCLRSFLDPDPETELRRVHAGLVKQLEELAEMVSGSLHRRQRTTLEALLTLYVHCRDVLMEIIQKKVVKPEDFEWTRQLRYQWKEQTSTCYVLQSGTSFIYGYEYLGCSPRLVVTPLTDRCWLTLTGALHLHLGGSPVGPAGTGKTETVKDLAKALGKHCLVFNCSEGLDYQTMGKFFSGMAQSGAWCCFDEFNRIDMEVLSVIASQIHTIKAAKDSHAMRFMFEGKEIRMNGSCGIFITMNPGYKGRVELPDNLKSLFRPVAMMVPDYQLIAEIMLFSEGFKSAKSLSGKLVNLYQLASKQLSQQDHYDFGMRAMKTVLVMAGRKRQELEFKQCKSLTAEEESLIIILALQEANLPKFLAEDVPLFESIMADLFPGTTIQKANTQRMEKAISIATEELRLQHWEAQVEKVIQLHNQILARHGVMLVGPTGGGKTTVRRILERALVILPSLPWDSHSYSNGGLQNSPKKGKVDTFAINPKCVTLGELFGEMDPNTMEWSDGLLASAVRKFAKHPTKEFEKEEAGDSQTSAAQLSNMMAYDSDHEISAAETADVTASRRSTQATESFDAFSHPSEAVTDWHWIILDGPVDTLWIENLNTVLDDTRTLCLASSERILLPIEFRMIFEVDGLSQASPATVSRCAMVYMDPIDLGWRPYVSTWISQVAAKLTQSSAQYLESLFQKSVTKGLNFINKHKKVQPFPAQEMGIVTNLCRVLDAFFDFISRNGGFGQKHKTGHTAEDQITSDSPSSTCLQASNKINKEYATSSVESMKKSANPKWFLQKFPDKLTSLLGKLYLFAFTWAFGGVLKREDETEGDVLIGLNAKDESLLKITQDFSDLVHDMCEGEQPLGIEMPDGDRSVFDYFVDLQTGAFVPWENLVPSTESLIQKGNTSFSEFLMSNSFPARNSERKVYGLQKLIPTVDTIRYSFLTSLLLMNQHPVLLTGESGVGKSTIIQSMLEELQKPEGLLCQPGTILGDVFLHSEAKKSRLVENIDTITSDKTGLLFSRDTAPRTPGGPPNETAHNLSQASGKLKSITASAVQFGAHTTAARSQAKILHKLVRRDRDTLGAPKFQKVVVFIDDLNMPIPEQYGAQPPLEWIRQFLELGGFYDAKQLVWKNVQDVSLVTACAPPGGGRSEISPRLLRHFSMIVLPQPSIQSLQRIFQVQLATHFQKYDFLPDVKKCRDLLVSCSIALYCRMCHCMLPTPAKCHYTFNQRDLFKVLQGLLQAHESVVVSKDTTAQLLVHEATRVLHDRLVDVTDREMFYRFLSDELHNYFKVSWPKEKLMTESPMFVDFLDMNSPTEITGNRIYRQVMNHKKLTSTLEELHMRINSANVEIPLVFFEEAIRHITRAARVFRHPGGHMMLVGLDGTGKATCAAFACRISGCKLYRLSLSLNYGHADFREDLKKLYRQTGLRGQRTVFLIADSDIVKESFLEDLNCILNSGALPDLFDTEELDSIVLELKGTAAEADVPDSRQAIVSFFWQRAYTTLHIVLATSPAGLTFRQRCRAHPAIVNCCTVDWYDEWPEEALLKVANSYFAREAFANENQDLKENVSRVCVEIHKSVFATAAKYSEESRGHYYITPSSYLEFLDTFSNILLNKKKKLLTDRNRFSNGLSKLLEATSLIAVMQEELVALGPQIEQKTEDIEELMAKLKKDSEVVKQVQAIVKQDEEIMAQETSIVQEYAEQSTKELNAVFPVLQEAVAALDALDKADISEIRVYANPPFLVLTVMSAVCVLLQRRPDWATAKLLLGDPGFLKRLVNLDKDSLPEKVFLHLNKYSRAPDFNPGKVGLVSGACRSLCQWVLAMEHYHEVHKVEEHQKSLQAQFDESITQKEILADRKHLTTRRLQRASALISALDDEKVRWKESVDRLDQSLQGIMGDTLISAAFVVYSGVFTAGHRQGLSHEWSEYCNKSNLPVTPAYSLIRTMAGENEVRKWRNEGLPPDHYSTENAIIVKNGRRWPLLIDPQAQAYKWICQMEGDKLRHVHASDASYMKVMENAIRLGEPILLQDVAEVLDPSLKPVLSKEIYRRGGQDFIKIGDSEIEYNQNFRLYMTTQIPNPHFLPAVCILVTIINFTVTFRGLEDQLLSSVVVHERPQLEQQRCQLLESIADDNATLLELENKSLTLLQKTEGNILDDQDLIDTLQRSKVTSKAISERIEASAKTEATIEGVRESYLPVATRGAVLYFVVADLVQLNYMYRFSLSWFHHIFVASMDPVNKTQIETSPAESSPSVLGTVRALSKQRSAVTGESRGERSPRDKHFRSHLQKIVDTLTGNVYTAVSPALFTEHQLPFSFLLCSAIMRNDSSADGSSRLPTDPGALPEAEWHVFLHSALLVNMIAASENKEDADVDGSRCGLPWVTESMWKQCQYVSMHLRPFSHLCASLTSNPQQWESLPSTGNVYHFLGTTYNSTSSGAATASSPRQALSTGNSTHSDSGGRLRTDAPWGLFRWEKLSSFQRLILIKILRPECLTSAVREFVAEKMGSRYLQSGGVNLKRAYEESDARTPLIFILSSGTDPATHLQRLAQEVRGTGLHLDLVSLGRGQGAKAEELICKAQILKGRWVFLQNCHLAASFMPRLRTIVNSFTQPSTNVDPQFRLWLSSKPDPSFPMSILQKGFKMAVEPPQGLKGKLLQTFCVNCTGEVTEKVFEKVESGPSWKRLLFSLCFFNAVVQERRKYGALGWNIPYEFTSSDLEVSMQMLGMLLETQQEIPWHAVHYLTGEVVYGGRVTDYWDRRCLLSILDNFYDPTVLQENYTFSSDGVYRPVSENASFQDARIYLESLPERDSPEIFGMHPNAERSFLESQAQLFLDTVVSLQPRITLDSLITGGGKSQDELVTEIISNIVTLLPQTVEGEDTEGAAGPGKNSDVTLTLATLMSGSLWAALRKSAAGHKDSLINSALLSILRQEIDRFNQLLSVMHQSLYALQQAIKGEIILTAGLEEVYNALLNLRIPQLWKQYSYESCKPLGSWIDDLIQRVNFFATWANQVISCIQHKFGYLTEFQRKTKRALHTPLSTQPEGCPKTPSSGSSREQPSSFWLSGFFFPQGFLTAVLQNYSRLSGISVDSLTFVHRVLPTIINAEPLKDTKRKEGIIQTAFKDDSPPAEGILIFGLYLDGARWNPETQALEDSQLHNRFYSFPEIQFVPKQISAGEICSDEKKNKQLSYECPLYRTPQRAGILSSTGVSTNYVTTIRLPSLSISRHWITRGVALLCQLDD